MTEKTKKPGKGNTRFYYKSIKTFEDACKRVGIDPEKLPDVSGIPEEFQKPLIAAFKLMIIYKAINNGWVPDWNNFSEYKYCPWFGVLSSGFGFSTTDYVCGDTLTDVGSRLCTNSSAKALYIATQFKSEYRDYFLYSE